MSQDPGADGRPPFQLVADELRAEIEGGRLEVGDRIPTQHELKDRFDVSRPTIQRALLELRNTGHIESHQGLGTFVADWQRCAPGTVPEAHDDEAAASVVSLPRALEAAFSASEVTMDVFTFTAETLNQSLGEPLARVRTGTLCPRSITLRLLVPDEEAVRHLPRSVADPADPRPARRMRKILESSTFNVVNTLRSLEREPAEVRPSVSVEIREVPLVPQEKLYVLNRREVLKGYYEVIEMPIRLRGQDGTKEQVPVYDVLGLTAPLFRHTEAGPAAQDTAIVQASMRWFDSVWDQIARRSTLSE